MQMNLSKILRKLLWHKKIHLTDGGTWERDLYVLLNSKSTGNYKYCYVDQFVLLDRKTGIAWNYFTHVHFSKKYKAEEDSTPYQDCRLKTTINKNRGLILFASHYIMTKENFWHCVHTIYQIVDLLVDTCSTKRKMLRIAGDDKPAEVVRSRLKKLNADHIRFVLDSLAENTAPVRNMKQYLLAMLYNVPTTMNLYEKKLIPSNGRVLSRQVSRWQMPL